jgi:hypothetical protein
MLTGESRYHTSIPLGFWTRVPHDRKQTGSPLDQWDMVWMMWDCRLSLCQKVSKQKFIHNLQLFWTQHQGSWGLCICWYCTYSMLYLLDILTFQEQRGSNIHHSKIHLLLKTSSTSSSSFSSLYSMTSFVKNQSLSHISYHLYFHCYSFHRHQLQHH